MTDNEILLARLKAAGAVHKTVMFGTRPYCGHCGRAAPCPTMLALDGEQPEKTQPSVWVVMARWTEGPTYPLENLISLHLTEQGAHYAANTAVGDRAWEDVDLCVEEWEVHP